MASLVDVVLIDADCVYPYNLRLVSAAKGFEEVEEVFAHLKQCAI
jgi:hypothetical protein